MSRALAIRYVRQLLARGYTVEEANNETCMGMWEPGGGGYEIRRGKIECPPFSKQTFSFAELAAEPHEQWIQPTLAI